MREPILGPGWKSFALYVALAVALTLLVQNYVLPLASVFAWEREEDPFCVRTEPVVLCKPLPNPYASWTDAEIIAELQRRGITPQEPQPRQR